MVFVVMSFNQVIVEMDVWFASVMRSAGLVHLRNDLYYVEWTLNTTQLHFTLMTVIPGHVNFVSQKDIISGERYNCIEVEIGSNVCTGAEVDYNYAVS